MAGHLKNRFWRKVENSVVYVVRMNAFDAYVLIIAIGLFAAYIPARRAARVEPLEALRHE
jgi:ABC-type lipoprotein release transport system permease subunit